MKELFLLAAVICFGMAILKFYTARMGRSAPQAAEKPRSVITGEEAKARLESNPSPLRRMRRSWSTATPAAAAPRRRRS